MNSTDKRKILISCAYFLAFLLLGATEAAIGPSLPSLAERAGTSLKGISLLFITQKAGYLLGSLFGGRLYDRLKAHILLGTVILGMGLGLFLVPLAPGLVPLLCIIFLVGLSQSTLDVGGNVLLVWINPPKVNSMMNTLHLFFGLGAFISPLILAASLRFSGGITRGFWILAAAVVPAALFVFRLPSPVRPEEEKSERKPAAEPRLVILISLFFFLLVAAEAAYGSWIYTYALTKNYADSVSAGYMTSAYWGALTLGRFTAIFLSLRIQPKLLIGLSLAFALIGLFLLVFLPGSVSLVWAVTLITGFSLGPLFASGITFASGHMRMTGSTTGIFLVGASVGGMILPWGIGQFFESRGPGVMPLSIFITTAVTLALFGIILAAVRNRRLT